MTDPRVLDGLREQLVSWRAELQGGARRVGWKIGFNLPAVREALGIEEPAIGHLTSATLLEDGATYSAAGAVRLVLEPEVAVEIGEGGEAAGYAAAIELADFDRPLDDVQAIVAGNIFHRAVVLGTDRRELEGRLEARVVVNGEERASAAAPDDYFAGVVALAARLLGEAGESLRPGDRIICGTITPPLPVGAGEDVTVELGGCLGSLNVRLGE